MTPLVAASINTDTPSAVIHPHAIAQLPSDDSPSSEPPPLPPKSSFWQTVANDPTGTESLRPLTLQIQEVSVKQPTLPRMVSVGGHVYYNFVPEVRSPGERC